MSVGGADVHVGLTDRLWLRRPTLGDVDVVLRLHQEPLAIAHNPADALAHHEQSTALVETWLQHWDEHGIGYCMVSWRCDVEVIGVCGVKVLTMNGLQVFNLLYRLSPPTWGQGVATEAAAAVIERARHHRLALPVVARVRPDNQASAGVALAAGLHRAPHLDTRGEDGPEEVYVSEPLGRDTGTRRPAPRWTVSPGDRLPKFRIGRSGPFRSP